MINIIVKIAELDQFELENKIRTMVAMLMEPHSKSLLD